VNLTNFTELIMNPISMEGGFIFPMLDEFLEDLLGNVEKKKGEEVRERPSVRLCPCI
jgi:hypothetical protein